MQRMWNSQSDEGENIILLLLKSWGKKKRQAMRNLPCNKLILPEGLCKETKIPIPRNNYLPCILISAMLHF